MPSPHPESTHHNRCHRHPHRSYFLRVIQAWCVLATGWAGIADAQPDPAYNPPSGYYADAGGLSGASLKTTLHQIIRSHRVIPYTSTATDVWDALKVLDEDPANSSNVLLIYSGVSRAKTDTNGDGNTTTTNESWEREHCWPKSFGISDTGADTSDLFNLRACRRSVNASRGNRIYKQAGTAATAPPNCPECLYDYDGNQGGIWTPRPSEKGDLARAMFYMAVRYDGSDSGTVDLELSATPDIPSGVFSDLPTLLSWSEQDPVSEEERRRNHLIYTHYQSNRNPFIDHPEMVAKVFGSLPDLPALVLTVAPAIVDEDTAATGTVSVSVPVASPLVVTLAKNGDPAGTEISIPASVTIPTGSTSITFPVSALADWVVDGNSEISLVGSSTGYQSGLALLTVRDTDVNPGGGSGPTEITGPGHYTQNFDSLPASTGVWEDDSTLPGWLAQRTGDGTSLVVGSGSSSTGGLYSYGTAATDRALGSLGSANAAAGSFAWGVTFRNSTAATLTLTTLSYTGEQWRYGGTAASQVVGFSYQTSMAPVSDLTPGADGDWISVSAMDFASPVISGTTGLLDGNAAANRSLVSATLNLQLPPGAWITLRWRDPDHSGGDHGLAIDDFRLDWTLPPVQLPPEITGVLAVAARQGDAFSYSIAASNQPFFFEAESLPDGLHLDAATGIISGTPSLAGRFEVTLLAGNTSGVDVETLVLTVAPAITPFARWSGGAPPAAELLQTYAVGGALAPDGSGEPPAVAVAADTLILTAIIRTADPALTVIGQAVTDLATYGAFSTPVQGTATGVDQSGVPAGFQRQEFRHTLTGTSRQFMRLAILLDE